MSFHPFLFDSWRDLATYLDNANTPTYLLGAAATTALARLNRLFHRRRDAEHARRDAALHVRLDEHAARHDEHAAKLDVLTAAAGQIGQSGRTVTVDGGALFRAVQDEAFRNQRRTGGR